MRRFWISWWQVTEDWRPVYNPKKEPEPLKHMYWSSGERCSDGAASMCAVVDAKNEADAKRTIRRYWPEAKEWRFCEEKSNEWLPGNRFPVSHK